MNKEVKQIIVIRKDLNMRKGKMCAQSAHASMKVFLDRKINLEPFFYLIKNNLFVELNEPMKLWINGNFKKIVVGVNLEKELLDLSYESIERKIPYSLVHDNGLTEFNSIETLTCGAFGPYWSEELNELTGHLRLL
jgi:PTH2 family peptidyl-tRNA hydrolase